MNVNQNNFKQEILNSNMPSLVDFYAEWCQPCKVIANSISTLKEDFAGKANVVKIDVDSNPELANEYNIKSVPTLLFFKDGIVVNTIKGTATKQKLEEALKSIS